MLGNETHSGSDLPSRTTMPLTDDDLDAIAERAHAYRELHVTLCPPQPLIEDLLTLIAALREERAQARRLLAA